jgi:hypothetical protein
MQAPRYLPHDSASSDRACSQHSAAELGRTLLRMLRDLNLCSSRVAVARDLAVHVDGCLSLDSPTTSPLCYRLRLPAGVERVLRIELAENALRLVLADRSGRPQSGAVSVELAVESARESGAALTARSIGARIAPHAARARDVEHFLRRLVRGAFRAHAA